MTSRHSFQLIKQNKIKISATRVAYYLTILVHFDKCSLFWTEENQYWKSTRMAGLTFCPFSSFNRRVPKDTPREGAEVTAYGHTLFWAKLNRNIELFRCLSVCMHASQARGKQLFGYYISLWIHDVRWALTIRKAPIVKGMHVNHKLIFRIAFWLRNSRMEDTVLQMIQLQSFLTVCVWLFPCRFLAGFL